MNSISLNEFNMRILRHILPNIIAIVVSIGVSSCFTGIESTPKITTTDVKRNKVTVKAEEEFLTDIVREPLESWDIGKRLYVTDNKINLIFGSEAPNATGLGGKYITYDGVRDIISVTGLPVAEFKFTFPEGRSAVFRSNKSIAEWGKQGYVEIPFTIEEKIIREVAERIEGREYYILTSQWYDQRDQARKGRKFIKVKIDSVLPGTTEYPVRLAMLDENGSPFHLFMSVGRGLKASRDFSSLMSFKDPRLKYPLITDKVWANIINGEVIQDMTQDECRLSLGQPDMIDRRPGYGYLYEIWSYENGVYLIFEDGLLRSFRR